MADITDFQIGQGETLRIPLQLKSQQSGSVVGTALDLSGWVFTGQLRENYTTSEIAATFDIDILDSGSGKLLIQLPATETALLSQRKYVYDVLFTRSISGSDVTRRLLEGGLTVRPSVTR